MPKIIARILLAAVAYVVGVILTGLFAPLLHLPAFKSIPGIAPQHQIIAMLLASPLLIVGLFPLSANLKGSRLQRCAALAALIYVTLGLNTLIESKIFTNLVDGSPWWASLHYVLPATFVALALTRRSEEPTKNISAEGNFGVTGWTWRICLAWLAFPVIYFVFGMFVGPIVVRYYNSTGVLGLHIPSFAVIIRTQLLRSAIFLAASLPFLLMWTKSRARLVFALGLAHAMTVGIFQLAQATFLPMAMRVAHGGEITCDSFAYAAVLAFLFTQAAKAVQPAVSKSAAA